jgi:cell division septation protein DedD
MGDPFTVVILVAAGSAADPTTYAIERAASAALGRGARVLVHESMGAPTDGEALAASPETGPSAIVEVTWGDGGHRVAVLRVHLGGSDRWLDRTIGFGPNDADSERARTIGFALASMIPESETSMASTPPAPAPPAPAPAAPVAEAANVSASPGDADHGVYETAPSAGHFALEMIAIGAAGVSASVETGGGGGALEAFVFPPLAFRFGGAVRAGSLAPARGSLLTLLSSAGVAVHPWRATPSRVFGASLRVDYVVLSQSLSHDSPAGSTTSTRSRALSGGDVVVEAEWLCAPGVELMLGTGVEETFATTHIDLNGVRVATLPPLNALVEAGLRLPF